MTEDQSQLWDYTVAAQSPAWSIPGMEPLLVRFVVTACTLRTLDARMAKEMADPDSTPAELEHLHELVEKVGRALVSYMRSLRLTPQSRTKDTAAKTAPLMPWEDFPEYDGDTA